MLGLQKAAGCVQYRPWSRAAVLRYEPFSWWAAKKQTDSVKGARGRRSHCRGGYLLFPPTPRKEREKNDLSVDPPIFEGDHYVGSIV